MRKIVRWVKKDIIKSPFTAILAFLAILNVPYTYYTGWQSDKKNATAQDEIKVLNGRVASALEQSGKATIEIADLSNKKLELEKTVVELKAKDTAFIQSYEKILPQFFALQKEQKELQEKSTVVITFSRKT